MSNLKELLAQRKKLEAELSVAHKKAYDEALANVHNLVNEFGFTAQEVFPWKPTETKKIVAKYLNEKTGQTWTGRGKAPAWIVGKDRDDFLIERPKTHEGPLLAEMAAAAARDRSW